MIIVDDEEKLIESLKVFFKVNDFDVKVFGKAFDAIKYVQAHECDVAICDIKMPGIKGDRLCSELRKNDPLLQCVVVTAYPEKEIIERLVRMGVTDIHVKPVGSDVLLAAVNNAYARKKSLKELMRREQEKHEG